VFDYKPVQWEKSCHFFRMRGMWVTTVGINGGKFFTVNGDYNNISVGSGAYPNATLCSTYVIYTSTCDLLQAYKRLVRRFRMEPCTIHPSGIRLPGATQVRTKRLQTILYNGSKIRMPQPRCCGLMDERVLGNWPSCKQWRSY